MFGYLGSLAPALGASATQGAEPDVATTAGIGSVTVPDGAATARMQGTDAMADGEFVRSRGPVRNVCIAPTGAAFGPAPIGEPELVAMLQGPDNMVIGGRGRRVPAVARPSARVR